MPSALYPRPPGGSAPSWRASPRSSGREMVPLAEPTGSRSRRLHVSEPYGPRGVAPNAGMGLQGPLNWVLGAVRAAVAAGPGPMDLPLPAGAGGSRKQPVAATKGVASQCVVSPDPGEVDGRCRDCQGWRGAWTIPLPWAETSSQSAVPLRRPRQAVGRVRLCLLHESRLERSGPAPPQGPDGVDRNRRCRGCPGGPPATPLGGVPLFGRGGRDSSQGEALGVELARSARGALL